MSSNPTSVIPPSTPPVVSVPVATGSSSSFGKVATDALKLVVGMASSPGGLALATSILGPVSPVILLVEQFGVRFLGPVLATWLAADISEAEVVDDLNKKGYKVAVFDPMAAFK